MSCFFVMCSVLVLWLRLISWMFGKCLRRVFEWFFMLRVVLMSMVLFVCRVGVSSLM